MALLSKIRAIFSVPDIAIDLGTANTRVFVFGSGMVVDTPTVVRVDRRQKLIGLKSPPRRDNSAQDGEFVMPVRNGVIKNVPAATFFLKTLLKRIRRFDFSPPRVIVCAPGDVSDAERAALIEVVGQAGASAATVVAEPLAAAIGAGLDMSSLYAQMLVDLGDGVTDIAVIRDGNLIQTAATRTAAGSHLHLAVQKMAAERYGARISRKDTEILTRKLGSVYQDPVPDSLKIYGIADGNREIQITVESLDVCEAIRPVVNAIVESICRAVREMSPDACAEVIETGICLTGGVAELPGLAELIAEKTSLAVELAPTPMYSVIDGASRMLETSAKTYFWQSRDFCVRFDR